MDGLGGTGEVSTKGRKPKPSKGASYLAVVSAQDAPPGGGAERASAGAKEKAEGAAVAAFEIPDNFTAAEAEIFRFIESHLRRLDILDEIDQIELQILASLYAEWVRLQDEKKAILLERRSLTYKTSGRNGVQYKTHAVVHQIADVEKRIGAFGSNFGLSPVDRERIKFLRRSPGDAETPGLFD